MKSNGQTHFRQKGTLVGIVLFLISTATAGQIETVRLTTDQMGTHTVVPFASYAPGGTWFCFVLRDVPLNRRQLYCADTDASSAAEVPHNVLVLPGSEGVTIGPTFSSDGVTVYFGIDNAVYRTALDTQSTTLISDASVAGALSKVTLYENSGVLVYEAFASNKARLYAVDLNVPGTAHPLNGPVTVGSGSSSSIDASPDGQRLVYLRREEGNSIELFSVTLPDGSPVKLNFTLPANEDVDRFWITPDSSRVVYITGGVLYTVPIAGGQSLVLSEPGAGTMNGTGVEGIILSGDGAWVAYLGNEDANPPYDLKIVPADASASPVTLAPASDVTASSYPFEFTPDDQRIIFRTFLASENRQTVDTVAVDGATSPIVLPGSALSQFHVYEPDADRVVYDAAPTSTNLIHRFFSAQVDGTQDAQFYIGAADTIPRYLGYSPATDRFVLRVDDDPASNAAHQRLLSVKVDGSDTQFLSPGDGALVSRGILASFTGELTADTTAWLHVESEVFINPITFTTTRSEVLRRYPLAGGNATTLGAASYINNEPVADMHRILAHPVRAAQAAYVTRVENGASDVYLATIVEDLFADGFESP